MTVARFKALFSGNTRSIGLFDPRTKKVRTEQREWTDRDVELHLQGETGAGQVAILDDGTCNWAALDLDNHGSDVDLPLADVQKLARDKGIPVVCCRSKSGGIHAYVFFDKPTKVSEVLPAMRKWAADLGYAGHEVFPKQTALTVDKTGKRALGNWINLPYFGIDHPTEPTVRYALNPDGTPADFDQFCALVEAARTSIAAVRAMTEAYHADAPPCLQRIFAKGIQAGHGQRNEALYNIAVYYRKRDAETYEAEALQANDGVFSKPLDRAEATRTIQSAGKPEYNYRCNQEPCRSLCDRTACVTRKFGISDAEAEKVDAARALPEFTDLVKYMSDPVVWEVTVNGKRIRNIDTFTLMRFDRMQQRLLEELLIVLPMMKHQEWQQMVGNMAQGARVETSPDDASEAGEILHRLRDFLRKAVEEAPAGPKREGSRRALLRGLPLLVDIDGTKKVVFRGPDFVDFMRRSRAGVPKMGFWPVVRDAGGEMVSLRVGAVVTKVWAVPAEEFYQPEDELELPDFGPEL